MYVSHVYVEWVDMPMCGLHTVRVGPTKGSDPTGLNPPSSLSLSRSSLSLAHLSPSTHPRPENPITSPTTRDQSARPRRPVSSLPLAMLSTRDG